MSYSEHHHRPSIFGPLLLIGLGGFLFLTTLGVLHGSLWNIVVRLWPLFFIIGGLDGLYRREGLVAPIVFAGLGTLFLLSNLGYLQVSVWQMALRLWPLLVIAIGLDLIIGRRSRYSAWLGVLLGLVIVGGIVFLSLNTQISGATIRQQPFNVAVPAGVTSLDATINYAVGNLKVSGGAPTDQLIEGNFMTSSTEQIGKNVQGDHAILSLSNSGSTVFFVGPGGIPQWDVQFNSNLPLDLRTSLAMGEQTLDLTGLNLSNLKVDQALGKVVLILPVGKSSYPVRFSGAVGEVVVRLPADLPVRIQLNTGLVSVQLPVGFTRNGNEVISPSGGISANRVDLQIDQAMGSVVIETLP